MENEFIEFRRFDSLDLAKELAAQLDAHGIAYEIQEELPITNAGPMFATGSAKYFSFKIKPVDFEKANQFLTEDEKVDVSEVEKDYYLFDFTDAELMDILLKADEWSAFDNVLARKILVDRGKNITDKTIVDLTKKRLDELKAPEPPQTLWITIGYLAALLGGVLGIFIGWHLSTYKKTLPNGERVFDYTESDRKHGKRIFYLSIVIFVLAIAFRMSPAFSS